MKNEFEIIQMAKSLPAPNGFRFLGIETSGGGYHAVYWRGEVGNIERKEVNITKQVKDLRKELNPAN